MLATLDYSIYPHLVERVFQFASSLTLLSLRSVCQAFCHRVDIVLARHLVLRYNKITPLGLPGWHPRLIRMARGRVSDDPGPSFVAQHVRVIDLEEKPHRRFTPFLRQLMEEGTVTMLRGVYLRGDPGRSTLSGPVQCVVHRYRKYPATGQETHGYATVYGRGRYKSVINMNYSGIFDGIGFVPLEWRYPGVVDHVLIFHEELECTHVHTPLESDWVNFQSNLYSLTHVVNRGTRRLTVVNVSRMPSLEVPDSFAITPPEGEQSPSHPLELHIRHEFLKVFTPGEYAERVSFLTLEEYAALVGADQAALEAEV